MENNNLEEYKKQLNEVGVGKVVGAIAGRAAKDGVGAALKTGAQYLKTSAGKKTAMDLAKRAGLAYATNKVMSNDDNTTNVYSNRSGNSNNLQNLINGFNSLNPSEQSTFLKAIFK